jgi:hypothetical protein
LIPRYDNDRHFRPGLTHEAHRLETIHARHKDINDEQIEVLGLEQPQARPTIVNSCDGMSIALKQEF